LSGKERQALLEYKNACSRVEDKLAEEGNSADLRPSRIWLLLEGVPMEAILFCLAVTRSDRVRMAISRHLTGGPGATTAISGMDLKLLGIAPGPLYGEILRAVKLEKIDGRLKDRESELDWVRRHYLAG
jgi:tRNA nucleotidyltransferase (CCA-adding enzyme)